MSPDWAEHAGTLVGLLVSFCGVLIGAIAAVVGYVLKREVGRITEALGGINETIGKLWEKLDTLTDSLHTQGESLAKLWGSHAERTQGACAPPDAWIPRSGSDRRSA